MPAYSVCFVCFSKQTVIIRCYNPKWLVFVVETDGGCLLFKSN